MSDATENKSFAFNANSSRDLIGYAGNHRMPAWPGQARIAMQFVLNDEEEGQKSYSAWGRVFLTVPFQYHWRRQLSRKIHVDGFAL